MRVNLNGGLILAAIVAIPPVAQGAEAGGPIAERLLGNQRVAIPTLQNSQAPGAGLAPGAPVREESTVAGQKAVSVSQSSSGNRRFKVPAIIGFAVGGAARVGGVLCSAVMKSRYDALNKGTVNASEPKDLRDSGKQVQVASGVLYGVEAAALVTGGVLWWLGSPKSPPATQVSMAPGQGGAMLVFSGVLP